MFASVWLDTAIGVVLFFLTMSFIATAAVEAVAQIYGWRARTLRKGIANLLSSVGLGDGATSDSNPWLRSLYQHSLMRGLYAPNGWAIASGNAPSYVPSSIFAGALLDLVTINGPLGELKAAQREWEATGAAVTALDDATRKRLAEQFDRLGRALIAAADEAPEALRRETERVAARLAALEIQAASATTAANSELAGQVQRMIALVKATQTRLSGDIKTRCEELQKFGFATFVPMQKTQLEKLAVPADLSGLMRVMDDECRRVADLLAWITSDTDRALGAGTALVDKIAVPELRDALKSLMAGAHTGVDDARLAVAQWFDNSMERVEGWYKRRTQLCSFVVGLFVAFAINADAINVISTISTNDKLRGELVALAQNAAAIEKEKDRADLLRGQIAVLPVGWYRTECVVRSTALDRNEPPRSCTLNDSGAIVTPAHLRLWKPVGEMVTWHEWVSPDVRLNVSLFSPFGWLITALAVMLGAPFWFDLLSTLVKMRSTGKTTGEKAAEATPKMSISTGK